MAILSYDLLEQEKATTILAYIRSAASEFASTDSKVELLENVATNYPTDKCTKRNEMIESFVVAKLPCDILTSVTERI